MSVLAFALGGVSLMGFPPSGAYLAKELLLGLVDWGAYLSVPPRSLSNPLALDALLKGIWPVLGGAVLTILLGRGRGGAHPWATR